MTPKHALPYGESGPYVVWEHTGNMRVMWRFADEDMAMQFAVSVGSKVESNVYDTF